MLLLRFVSRKKIAIVDINEYGPDEVGAHAGFFPSISRVLYRASRSATKCPRFSVVMETIRSFPLESGWIVSPVIKSPLMRLLMPRWITQALISRYSESQQEGGEYLTGLAGSLPH